MLTFTSGTFDCQSMEIAEKAEVIITAAIAWKAWEFVLVIAWFGGQLQINFLSKILKFFCNCPSL